MTCFCISPAILSPTIVIYWRLLAFYFVQPLVDKTISSFNVDSMGSGVAPGKTVLYQGDVRLAQCLVYTVTRNLVLCQCVKGPISIINAISSFPFFRW